MDGMMDRWIDGLMHWYWVGGGVCVGVRIGTVTYIGH